MTIFNGKDTSLVNTLQLTSLEAECYRKLNLKEEDEEDPKDLPNVLIVAAPLSISNPDLSN